MRNLNKENSNEDVKTDYIEIDVGKGIKVIIPASVDSESIIKLIEILKDVASRY